MKTKMKQVIYKGASNSSFTYNKTYDVLAEYSTDDYLVKDNEGIKTVMYGKYAEFIYPDLTDSEFLKLITNYYGEVVDDMSQVKLISFNGEELKDFLNYILKNKK